MSWKPLVGALTLFAGLNAPAISNDEAADAAEPHPMDGLLEQYDVPGLAIANLSDCRLESVENYGVANRQTGAPVSDLTAFEAASLSKPVFAYLVMQLADEGVIDLDAPISERVDAPRVIDRQAYRQVTPRMVLTHRTGMPNWVGDTDQLDRTDAIPFLAPPGDAYTYSGEAFFLLQRYIEDVTGASLDTIFKTRLGAVMPNSTFAPPLSANVEPSRGYQSRDDAMGRAMTNLRSFGGSAGGLVTTARDYAGFLAHVCAREGLSETAWTDMVTPVSPVPDGNGPGPMSWALGWGVLALGETQIVLHDGNNDEYRALAGFVPETGEGFVFLANGANGAELINALVNAPEGEN